MIRVNQCCFMNDQRRDFVSIRTDCVCLAGVVSAEAIFLAVSSVHLIAKRPVTMILAIIPIIFFMA